MKQIFSKDSKHLPLILKLTMAMLILLIVMAFILPLSDSEQWFLVLTEALLFGTVWTLLAHVEQD